MKKGIYTLVAVILLIGVMSVPVFAHGCGNGRSAAARTQTQAQYTACSVEGCAQTGVHQHGDSWYCHQAAQQGDYAVCTVEGCALLGLHEHDGSYYYCQSHGADNGCRR